VCFAEFKHWRIIAAVR